MWVRGLKRFGMICHNIYDTVAPRVGAWIETRWYLSIMGCQYVAPRVGAWIETLFREIGYIRSESHPVWVRGLKL